MVGGGVVIAYIIYKSSRKDKLGFANAIGSIGSNIKDTNLTLQNKRNVTIGSISKSNYERGFIEGIQMKRMKTTGIPITTNVGGVSTTIGNNQCYWGILLDDNSAFNIKSGTFYVRGTTPQNQNVIKKVEVGYVTYC